jgi:cytoskeletal protein RodZ
MSSEPIGDKLKKVRQNKGLSLEDVQKKTKIHLNILKAIEGDGLTNLSPIYLKGFLKIYCKFLGIDPKECIPDYKESSLASIKNSAASPREEDEPLKTPSFMENAGLRLNSLRPNKKLKNVIIFILIIAASGVILSKLVKFISTRPKVSPAVAHIKAEREQAKPKIKPQNPAVKPVTAETTKLPKETSGGISLVIAAKENCLIFVKVDGRVVMHRVLERGRSDSWKAKDRIDLTIGNAAAVELIVNGQRFTNLGRRGHQLKNITITEKDGLRIPR